MTEVDFALDFIPENIAPAIRGLISGDTFPVVSFLEMPLLNKADAEKSGLSGIWLDKPDKTEEAYKMLQGLGESLATFDFIHIKSMGAFVTGDTKEEADIKRSILESGGSWNPGKVYDLNNKRLKGRVAVITGGAQGFGLGIAEYLADNGAQVVIADINFSKAKEVAADINKRTGGNFSIAIDCDVSDEKSIKEMCQKVTREYGGIDLMQSNAGISEPGSLETMSLEMFEKVTRINYTAFFLVCKYSSRPMKIQSRFNDSYFADIIQTNSKAGLKGWLNNFAYCGSKFGSIGLVQSISRELVRYRIKVNCVCPGNYYTGPMWGDPEKGLFVKYFKANKVPGAKSPEDVREWYSSQEIFGRGCYPKDVARAIMYAVEQEYETGQAIPVAGGLEMLA